MSVKIISAAAIIMASSFAAQAAQVQFNVEASIPDNTFYVIGTGWEAETQRMAWNENNLSLNAFNKDLKMKNANGGIKAYLQDAAVLTSSSNPDPIPLTVKVYNQVLPVGAAQGVEVVNATEASTEKTRVMNVSQTTAFTSANRPAAGEYSGAITMMFDSVPDDEGSR
ncbi:CS1 type fimbrial major subunit [Pantoea sp. ME81]|uniref:CS1 type fimbrial major subunit n=1 Tax=Pantoea sp. ME81 TaxID=2743935 RepID=UPI0015F3EACF|nr:CS1 type fimbrial major subunit [Pantoea sp. ME81]